MNYNKTIVTTCISLMLAVAASASESRYVTPVANDTSKVVNIDEVVVVSQPKEAFYLRQQPLSSSMFDAHDLQRMSMNDLRGLSAFVPSFTMPSYGSRYTSSIYIRGIGSRINSPAVGVYADGLPLMSKSAYNYHNYELARADVLRGPQGTLYGINTEGGLIRTYSLSPMNYQGTRIKLGLGSHFTRHAEVAHYAKPNEHIAWSLAGFYKGQKGFFTNNTTGERADKSNEAGGKLRLIYQQGNGFSVDYILDYQYVRQNAFPYGLWNGETQPTVANRQSNYRRNMLNTGVVISKRWENTTFSSTTSFQYLKDYMLMDIDYMAADFMQMEERQHQNSITHEMVVKGQMGLTEAETNRAWRWTTGTFTSYQWNKTEAPVAFFGDMDNMLGTTIQTAMYKAIVQTMAARFEATGMAPDRAKQMAEQMIEQRGGITVTTDLGVIPGTFRLPTFNQGVFHESNIDLTRRLTLTLGLRYDYSKVRLDYDTRAEMNCNVMMMGSAASSHLLSKLSNSYHNDFHQLLPKLGLSYKFGDNGSNLYGAISKGYRAGGYNYQMFSDILQTELSNNSSQRGDYEIPHTEEDYKDIEKTIAYAPETTWNYELGAHINLPGNKIQMDMAVYLTNVNNLQLSVMAGNYGFGRMMVNAGRSRSLGGELSLRGSHLDNHLTWTASYAFTQSTFRDYRDAATTGNTTTQIDYRHHRVPFIPCHTLGSTIDYRIDTHNPRIHALVIGANMAAQGSIYWNEANTLSQPFYATLGAHCDALCGNVIVSLWGRNITNSRPNTFVVESSATGKPLVFAQQANPFHMGIDVKLNF